MAFKRYSESIGREVIQPQIPRRSWDMLELHEKEKVISHIRPLYDYRPHGIREVLNGWELNRLGEKLLSVLKETITTINREYRRGIDGMKSRYLDSRNDDDLIIDFENIIHNASEKFVYELISIWLSSIDHEPYQESIVKNLNDVFEQFGVNMVILDDSFIARQDSHIIKELYVPVLSFLSHEKRKLVEKNVRTIFEDYRVGGYDKAVTLIQTTLESYMKILLGDGYEHKDFSTCIQSCIDKKFIPEHLIKFKSYFSLVRKDANIAHTDNDEKRIDANECLTAINFMIIFLQACIQYNSN